MSWAHSAACPVEYIVLSPMGTLCREPGILGGIVEFVLEYLSVQVTASVHDNLRVPTWPLGCRQDNFRRLQKPWFLSTAPKNVRGIA